MENRNNLHHWRQLHVFHLEYYMYFICFIYFFSQFFSNFLYCYINVAMKRKIIASAENITEDNQRIIEGNFTFESSSGTCSCTNT